MINWAKGKYADVTEKYPAHAKIARFLVSGGTAAGTNLVLLFLFTHFAHIWYLFSSVLSFLVAFFVSFGLQKFWTFKDRTEGRLKSQALVYFVTVLAGLGINTLLVYLLVEHGGVNYIIAQIIGNGLIAIGNYFVYKEFIFKPEGAAGESQAVKEGVNSARSFVVLFLLVIAFLIPRLAGINLPYHQDEWKNVAASATIQGAGQFFTHPPFMQMFFVAGHMIFGTDHFRFFPLLFSIAALFALYIVVKRRVSDSAALWSVFLFALCFYNILGSLQTDVDGSALPLLFLLAVYAYDRFTDAQAISDKKKWLGFVILACLVGFLVKLSFIIVIGVLILDYLLSNWGQLSKKEWGIGVALVAGFGIVYVALLYIIQAIYPAFSISSMLGHANSFTGATGRDYTQIVVQGVKSFYYLSPLLLIPLLFTSKEIFKKTRIFWLYLILGTIFYYIVFDFSRGALDKYTMFAIVPLAAIVGTILTHVSNEWRWNTMKWPIILGIIAEVVLKLLNFIPQTVAALYPKTEWFSRVLHLHWNVLTPLTGGSGPLGFYVSFVFIAMSFIVSLILGIIGLCKKEWQPHILVMLILIGLSYNGIFAEELLFGKINGSAPDVLAASAAFIAQNPAITHVLTYNDIGAGPLSEIGKYAGRFYATPDNEDTHAVKFSQFTGNYLVVDMPHLYENGFYGQFFAGCTTLFQTSSGKINGFVYNCSKSKKTIGSL